jgi:hypothetical protein
MATQRLGRFANEFAPRPYQNHTPHLQKGLSIIPIDLRAILAAWKTSIPVGRKVEQSGQSA